MDATFSKDGPRYTLLFVRHLPHPPEKVWRVLTERELLRQWFPCDIDGEWREGAELQFTFLHGEGEGLSEEDMRGEVLKIDPPHYLEFSWGDHIYQCKLIPEGDGCRFVFSDNFAEAAWGARNAVGWEFCLENLGLLLDGAALVKFAVTAWQKRFDYYAKKFEADAGPQEGLPDDYPVDESG